MRDLGIGNQDTQQNNMIVVSAPSGAGKSSLVSQAIQRLPGLVDIITFTTRQPRPGEVEGETYHFVSEEKFRSMIEADAFAEHAQVHNRLYGTPMDQILRAWEDRKSVIMDIDIQGAESLRKKFPQAKTIFIVPPSMEELRRRILKRSKGEVPADLELRLRTAEIELQERGNFHYQILNDDFKLATEQFVTLVKSLIGQ